MFPNSNRRQSVALVTENFLTQIGAYRSVVASAVSESFAKGFRRAKANAPNVGGISSLPSGVLAKSIFSCGAAGGSSPRCNRGQIVRKNHKAPERGERQSTRVFCRPRPGLAICLTANPRLQPWATFLNATPWLPAGFKQVYPWLPVWFQFPAAVRTNR